MSPILRIFRAWFVCRNDIIPQLVKKLIEFARPFHLIALELIIEEIEELCAKRLKVRNIKALLVDDSDEGLPPCFRELVIQERQIKLEPFCDVVRGPISPWWVIGDLSINLKLGLLEISFEIFQVLNLKFGCLLHLS